MTLGALLWAVATAQFTPVEAQALFTEANEAALAGDTASARSKYLKLLESGHGGPDVLYNLGTASLMAKDVGHAALYLERARKLAPDDDDIAGQLAAVRAVQVDKVIGAEVEAPFLNRVADAVNPQAVGIAFLLCLYAGLALAWSTRWAERKLWLGLSAASLLAVSTVLGAAVGVHAYITRTVREGVVMAEATPALEVPREGSRTSFEVHAGLKLRLMEVSGKYTRVRLPNALEGWVETGALEPL